MHGDAFTRLKGWMIMVFIVAVVFVKQVWDLADIADITDRRVAV